MGSVWSLFYWGVLVPHPAMLRVYSRLCTEGLLLTGSRGHMRCQGLNYVLCIQGKYFRTLLSVCFPEVYLELLILLLLWTEIRSKKCIWREQAWIWQFSERCWILNGKLRIVLENWKHRNVILSKRICYREEQYEGFRPEEGSGKVGWGNDWWKSNLIGY